MAEIKYGDKVKLNRTLSYKKISMKNGEVENESVESWDEGTEHIVKAVIGELFVVLENVSSMVPVSYVEKVEEKYYTGKIVCIGVRNDLKNVFSLGKVYDVVNGTFIFDNGNELERVNSLEDLNGIYGMEFIEIKNPESIEEKTYYNGKVICIYTNGYDDIWTPGKIYKFVDGIQNKNVF